MLFIVTRFRIIRCRSSSIFFLRRSKRIVCRFSSSACFIVVGFFVGWFCGVEFVRVIRVYGWSCFRLSMFAVISCCGIGSCSRRWWCGWCGTGSVPVCWILVLCWWSCWFGSRVGACARCWWSMWLRVIRWCWCCGSCCSRICWCWLTVFWWSRWCRFWRCSWPGWRCCGLLIWRSSALCFSLIRRFVILHGLFGWWCSCSVCRWRSGKTSCGCAMLCAVPVIACWRSSVGRSWLSWSTTAMPNSKIATKPNRRQPASRQPTTCHCQQTSRTSCYWPRRTHYR
jgi:hypothetical protein